MGKIAEIIESGRPPGFDLKTKSERDPDRAVPRAFKSLTNDQVRKFTKETGFSVDHVKRVWEMAIVGLLILALPIRAADINKGYAFTPTDRVTNTKLNNLVDAATINTTFFTDKSAATPTSGDVFLMVRSGNFYKVSFADMVLNYDELITGQSEDTQPATGDFLLTYDISAAGLKKIQVMSLWTNDFLINGRAALTNVGADTTYLLGYDTTSGTYGKTTVSNLTQQLFAWLTFTNLAEHTAPTNLDRLLIWDSTAGTNKYTTLSGFYTNLPTATTNASDSYLVVVSNGVPTKTTLASLSTNLYFLQQTNGFSAQRFTSWDIPIGSSVAKLWNTNHGLAGTPRNWRWVLKCVTADLNYSAGDEVDYALALGSGYVEAFTCGVNSTNVWAAQTDANPSLNARSTGGSYTLGTSYAITPARWKLKCYAEGTP